VPETLLGVPLPHLGVSVEEATVIAWHRAPGEPVREGEPLCDVATDKVDTEIAAPADGVLARIVADAGDTVPVGGLLAELRVGGAGEAAVGPPTEVGAPAAGVPDVAAPGVTSAAALDVVAPAAAGPAVASPRRFGPAAAAEAAVASAVPRRGGSPVSSPVARRLAAEHGIDLAGLSGTGLRGRVGKADVLSAVRERGDAATPPAAPAGAPPAGAPPAGLPRGYDDVPHRVVPTTRRRRVIAEHMMRSRQTAAHMSPEAEVDMSAAGRARDALGAVPGRRRPTHLALIARVACTVLAEFPDLNATFEPERTIRWGPVNLGVAVDTPEGLVVPVIHGCERLTAPAIADAIADLAGRARAGTLTPDDMRAGTFTISNPGSAGGDSAMAIINQPQVAILGTPRIVRRPVVVTDEHGEEAIGIRPMMTLTLTFDHRAVDGAEATRCVVRMKQLLEAWTPEEYA
jgi:2-oxoglutarate dehydrogenase E2 component (dihydrolipoamide succinyltransferase)